jgi:hypothetical protein
LTYGGRAEAATVSVTGKVEGAIDKFSIAGRVVPSDTAPDAQLQISASGVRAGALVAYMPPTIRPTLKDGSLKMTLDAGMSPHAKGGVTGRVIVTGLDYREASDEMPLLRLDSATVKCDRYDPASKVIALDEISLAGLEADVRTAAEGLRLLGIETVAAAAAAAAPVAAAPAAAAVKPQQAAAMPVAVAAPAEKAAPTTQDVARAVAANRLDLPLITLAKLNVGVQRLRVTDMTRPSAAPIAVEDFTLTGQRLEMLGNDSENRPPMDLAIDCRPAPIADSLKARLKLAPFAQRPSVHVNLTAAGIQGDRLLSAFPELKPKIDASKLTDGQLSAELKAEVKMDRRDLLRRDFSRPFEADVSLKGLGLHNGDGTALASVEEFRSDGVHVEPRTGAVRAKSLEISNLAAAIMRDADGLHALGLVFRTPTTQPAGAQTASAVAPPVAESVQPAAVAKATPTTAPTSTPTRPDAEQRIDALIVSGMNVSFEDHTVDPPLRIPITALELEARDLSNYLMYDADKSMRFSLLVNSGKVPLPRGSKKGSPPAAPTTQPIVAMDDRHDAAAAAPAGGPTTQSVAMDERELFAQLTASGKLSLYPAPKGWVKTSLSGLELGALKGEARQAGFDLSGGTFDANIDTRFLDSGTLDMHPKFVFVDLSIAEPTKGPVERYFSLPVSLDGAVNVLEDASGQITVPLHVVVEQGKVNSSDVTASVVGAVTGIVVTAIANAPLKAGMGVASLVGIQFNTKRPPPGPVTLAFDASATGLGQSERDLPKALVERLIKEPTLDITLKHDLSSVDVDLAGQRVNPRGDDAMAVSYSLRQNKMALLKERAQVAGRARGELGSGVNADATLLRLRNIEQELAVIEDSLDDLNELLRPGAGRQALRRTRAACIAIGEQRLISVRDLLMASGIPNINERIHVTHAKFNPDDTIDHGRVMMTFAPRAKQ